LEPGEVAGSDSAAIRECGAIGKTSSETEIPVHSVSSLIRDQPQIALGPGLASGRNALGFGRVAAPFIRV
jgi:hypothetical protein